MFILTISFVCGRLCSRDIYEQEIILKKYTKCVFKTEIDLVKYSMIQVSNLSVSVVYDSFVKLGGRERYLWARNNFQKVYLMYNQEKKVTLR